MILAIDPGNELSAYCMIDRATLQPLDKAKVPNADLRALCYKATDIDSAVIERVESYGMGVGKTIFDTCIWTGKFSEALEYVGVPVTLLPRRSVKLHICGQARAKDSNIIAALQERFGVKGTKKNPGWFYGFAADMWQAYALGVTYIESMLQKKVG